MSNENLIQNYSNSQIIEKYLLNFSKASANMRRSSLTYFFSMKHFGYESHVSDIEKYTLMDYFNFLKQDVGIAIKTKINKWSILKSFLEYLMEYYDDFIVKIPARTINWGIQHKKPNSNRKVYATIEEIQQILNYFKINNFKHYLIFRGFAELGWRKGGCINAKYEDVNIKGRYIETIEKTGEKVYYFSREFAKLLEIYIEERKKLKTTYKNLFISQHKKPYSERPFNKILKQVLEKLGIEKNITCHTFRRSLNNLRKKQMKCNNEDAKILLGHKLRDVNIISYTEEKKEVFLEMFDKYNPYQNLSI